MYGDSSMTVTARRTPQGIRVTGVSGYLGYTNTTTLTTDADARKLIEWLRRDGDHVGADAVETLLPNR